MLSRINEQGREEFLQKVYTDLNGKQLSDDETLRRIAEREKREKLLERRNEVKPESSTQSPSDIAAVPWAPVHDGFVRQPASSTRLNLIAPTPIAAYTAPTGGCQHASNESQSHLDYKPLNVRPPAQRATSKGCNCGTGCQCIHCPEHANNEPTLQYNHQQFTHMANNSYFSLGLSGTWPSFQT